MLSLIGIFGQTRAKHPLLVLLCQLLPTTLIPGFLRILKSMFMKLWENQIFNFTYSKRYYLLSIIVHYPSPVVLEV